MESKSEVSNCLKVFLSEAKTAGHKIKEFFSDGERVQEFSGVWNAAIQWNKYQKRSNPWRPTITWELVNVPQDRKAIGSRWVYKIKKNANGTVQCFKAHLVAKGYSQKVGMNFNETFSPVVRWDTIRTLLGVAAYKKLKLVQFDVKTAFLYGDLQEDIYMHQPQGFEDGTGQICK
ncbi:Retrovirus-related Pol polyprotein from transposon TNT 1-94 [Araneus ventricosus]|uniref:Retrovirus-related Pol polyprotein from transposon TNT 1-94 n=1 Tax=Araneus ventricosus TaxID=182803 RepID=A0A4Y2Q8F6_ARAVE|nr:Retrovirus-related Pol polyprotein from transposon TNT 1-94 [Araneus ventricosus]